jgi:polymerase delta-interacting protein 2
MNNKCILEAVTFLGNQERDRNLYAIPGLDYVAHEDVIPYTSTERTPIEHELFDKFLMHDSEATPNFVPREHLKSWQERHHLWLELSDVSKDVTHQIRVTVIPFYIGSRSAQGVSVHWWRYSIRVENLNPDEAVTLRERHWRIFSLSGTLETVRGKGVVGQEPRLSKEYPAFQYSSHVSLSAPSGHMWGTFKMEKDDGSFIEVRIPPFNLECKSDPIIGGKSLL